MLSELDGRALSATVVSDLPGRIRVRLGREQRNAEALALFAKRVESEHGILKAAFNSHIGSLTVQYDLQVLSQGEIPRLLSRMGLDLEQKARESARGAPTFGSLRRTLSISPDMPIIDC